MTWGLVLLGVLLSAGIGLMQGRLQSPQLALALLGVGFSLAWLAVVLIKPEAALVAYTGLAVNLNSFELPLPIGGARLSPDIVLMSVLIVGVLLRGLATRGKLVSLPISAPYLIFLAVPLITIAWSPTPVESIRGLFRFIGYYALMWLIVDTIRSKAQVRRMVLALILSTVLPVVSGLYQAFTGSGQTIFAGEAFNRIYGFAGGPFTLAFYLIMVSPLLLLFFLSEREPRMGDEPAEQAQWHFNRGWLAVLLALVGVSLVLTFIRGAWIALIVSLLALGLLRGSLRYRQLLVSIPVAAAAVLFTFTPAMERLQQVSDPTSTLYGRIEVWKLAVDWLLASPLNLLVGVGMKAFEYYYVLMAGPTTAGLYWRRESFLIGNRPHNEILGFLLDVGLIGVIALLAAMGILLRRAWRIYRHSDDANLRQIALAFLIGSVGLAAGAMGDNVLSQPAVAVYFWIMAGLIMAINRHLMPPAAESLPS